jgi:signal peptidase I
MPVGKIIKKAGSIIFIFILIVVLAGFMKVFLFASFKTTTHSMEPAIIAGDYILVNKLILGPRIYEKYIFGENRNSRMKRIWGLRSVKRNDVLVFDFPYKMYAPNKIIQGGGLYYVKRCIAIPGDTFYIENGIYKVKGISESLGSVEQQYEFSQMDENSLDKRLLHVFPKDTMHFRWTVKNWGPLYVPAKGDKLLIDSKSFKLYKNLIEYETGGILSLKDEAFLLDNHKIESYTFCRNYYFVAGDFVSESEDSRHWGLLPDDLIIGKAIAIWKSKDINRGKYRWDRFLKVIK